MNFSHGEHVIIKNEIHYDDEVDALYIKLGNKKHILL